jgi:sugar lactone lactonase YvrE
MSRTQTLALALALVPPALTACSDDPAPPPQPDLIALPGDGFYPESLSAGADGTLSVGSLGGGQVVAFRDGATAPETIVGNGSGVTSVAGVLVRGDELWLCSVDTRFQRPTEVKSFALDGTPRATFPLDASRFCNDLAFDAAGALYVTDSFSGTILRLPRGGTALEPWLVDPSLTPQPGAFGLDGIVIAGGALYVNRFDTGALYRVAINPDGSAGAVTPIAVSPALVTPDGMRALDDRTLLLVEGNRNTLVEVALDGDAATATVLTDQLDMPTSVALARGSAWVTEGQLGRLLAQPPVAPVLPFSVRRVDL